VITKDLSRVRLIALSFVAFLFAANVMAFAQDAAGQTKGEIERLQRRIS
jgi:hypothetical protein